LMVSFLVCVPKIFAPWHEVRRRDEDVKIKPYNIKSRLPSLKPLLI
jgi:hypothetical protein